MRTILFIPVAAFLLVGCARYEYDLVAPPELASHIGQQPRIVPRPPLVYRLQSYENRLVLRIDNPTEAPVALLGHESFIVDPAGESHALASQTIAPGSFIKLILPPLRPRIQPHGPVIGFGIGYRIGRATEVQPAASGAPRYLVTADPTEAHWEWDGEGDVRLMLAYERSGERFVQAFAFRRVKM